VAQLPGIYKYAITLPDGHEGYGFPIGGVAATDYENGVISPGGVGYDINCGVRLLSTTLTEKDVRPKLAPLAESIFRNVPSGLGSRRKDLTISSRDLENLATEGVQWLIDRGLGWAEDANHCEENGRMANANSDKVSNTAKNRGLTQIGTLVREIIFLKYRKLTKFSMRRRLRFSGLQMRVKLQL
jgi:tRNA-splicing ligase RtcB